MLRYRNDLIFWLLFDQAKSSNSIPLKSGKKNENENVKENEYDEDAALLSRLVSAEPRRDGVVFSARIDFLFHFSIKQKVAIEYN